MKNSTLFRLGLAAIALRSVLQMLLDRTHHSTDLTEFVLGVLFGAGIGMLMLFVWRNGRGSRSTYNLRGCKTQFDRNGQCARRRRCSD